MLVVCGKTSLIVALDCYHRATKGRREVGLALFIGSGYTIVANTKEF